MISLKEIVQQWQSYINQVFWYFILQGVLLVIFGILVIVYPMILVILAALLFVFLGIASIWMAVSVCRVRSRINKIIDKIID